MQHTSSIPVFMEYKNIFLGEKTGLLKLRKGKIKKSVYFRKGNIVKADSNAFDERLGVLLNLLGIISDSQYDYISGLINIGSRELGEILINEHFISRKDLVRAVNYRTRRIAINSFSMIDSSWEYSNEIPESLSFISSGIPISEIIYDGSKRKEISSYLHERYFFYSPKVHNRELKLEKMLPLEEYELLKFINENPGLSNREIISRENISPDFFWEMISVLFMLDLITFDKMDSDEMFEDDIYFLLKMKNDMDTGNCNLSDILDIKDTDSKESVQEKFNDFISKYEPERFGSALAPEIKKTAEFVKEKLVELYEKLLISIVKKEKEQLNGENIEETIPVIVNENISKDNVINIPPENSDKITDEEKINQIFNKAKALYNRNHFDEAIPILKDILRVRKNDYEILLLLGKCQTNVQFFSYEAFRNLSRAIELKPLNYEPVFFLGELFKKEKKTDKALKCYDRVLELQPDHFNAKKEIEKLRSSVKKKKKFFGKIRKN